MMRTSVPNTPFKAQDYARRILECNVASFVELAVKAPALWAELQVPIHRREVATLLGWPQEFAAGHYEQAGLTDFVSIVLNSGVASMDELWFLHPGACDHLRCRDLLNRVLSLLGFLPVNVEYPNDIGFYIARCAEAGNFEIWRDIDHGGFKAAVEFGLIGAINAQVAHMPVAGYPTAGGHVFCTNRLIVARLLEMAGVPFRCGRIHYGAKPIPGLTPFLSDFAIHECAVDVVITGPDGVFREGKLACRLNREWRRNGKSVVVLDGGVLQTDGLVAFVAHARVELGKARLVPGDLSFDPRRCLALKAASKPGSDNKRGG